MEALSLSSRSDLLTNDLLCCTVLLYISFSGKRVVNPSFKMVSRCAMSTALISYICVSDDEDGSTGSLICKVFTTHPRRLKVIEMPSIKGGPVWR